MRHLRGAIVSLFLFSFLFYGTCSIDSESVDAIVPEDYHEHPADTFMEYVSHGVPQSGITSEDAELIQAFEDKKVPHFADGKKTKTLAALVKRMHGNPLQALAA